MSRTFRAVLTASGDTHDQHNGNFTIVRTIRGDDDDVVRVRAGNGAGQVCARSISLDD